MSRTYAAALTAFSAGVAATTTIAELAGSATKKIALLRLALSATILTTAQDFDLQLILESSLSTGGTAVTATGVPFDNGANAITNPPTAILKGFTVAPVAGTLVAAMAVAKLGAVIAPAAPAAPLLFDFTNLPITLRPTLRLPTQAFALNFAGATPGAVSSISVYAWWTEDPLNS